MPNFKELAAKTFVEIVFQFRFWVILVGFVLIYFVAKYVANRTDTDNKDVVAVITVGGVFLTLFYHMINYENSQRKFKHDVKTAREILSFNTAVEWHKPAMLENMKSSQKFIGKHKQLVEEARAKELYEALEKEENDDAKAGLISIFNYFESISLAVQQGIMDEEFIKGFFGSLFEHYYNNFLFYIEYRRRIKQNQKIWKNFTFLAKKWIDC